MQELNDTFLRPVIELTLPLTRQRIRKENRADSTSSDPSRILSSIRARLSRKPASHVG